MKTFETEKDNIPDGATHYSDGCDSNCFAWYKKIHNTPFLWCVGYEEEWIAMIKPDEFNDNSVKPIPQTKEVEWENGDKCMFAGEEYTFGCVSPVCDQGSVVIFDEVGDYHGCYVGELSKPETQEAKEKREELEAAYDLYLDHYGESCHTRASYEYFKNESVLHLPWISTVRKTGYRKESE